MGDPAGIGPRASRSASWRERQRERACPSSLYGDPDVLAGAARALGVSSAASARSPALAEACGRRLPMRAARLAGAHLGAAVDGDAADRRGDRSGDRGRHAAGEALGAGDQPHHQADASTLPQLPYPGHTEFLAELARAPRRTRSRPQPVMMLVADELKVVPATVHIPLSAVAARADPALCSSRPSASRRRRWRRTSASPRPRIAVAGLNSARRRRRRLIGARRSTSSRPAIAELAAEGLAVTGPHAADTLFHAEARRTYDAVIAMYHDQALIPSRRWPSTAASTSRSACRSCAPRRITAPLSPSPARARRGPTASSQRLSWLAGSPAARRASQLAPARMSRAERTAQAPTGCRRCARSSAPSASAPRRASARTSSSIST